MERYWISLKRIFRFLSLLLVVKFAASELSGAASPSPQLAKVTVAYTTVGGILTPIWIPVEKGIFQKYGLDVSMNFVSTGPVVVSALIAGEIDIAAAGGEPIVGGILGGAELTIIGFGSTTTPLSLFVIPTITQFEQLRGGVLAVSRLTSSGAYMLKVGLRKHGLEPFKDVTIIQAGGIPESFAALQGGKVQGAILSPPTTYKAEAAGFRRLWNALGIEYPSLVIATRKSYLRDSADVALRYLQALAEGIYIFKTDKEEAIRVMSKFTKVTDRKILENTYADNSEVHSQTMEPIASGVKSILETMAATNPKAATARPEDFIDPRLVKKLEESGFFKKLTGR
jgi:ABC-type nitrate/sulfonate/bicarbonate transport system substrate-binding protein